MTAPAWWAHRLWRPAHVEPPYPGRARHRARARHADHGHPVHLRRRRGVDDQRRPGGLAARARARIVVPAHGRGAERADLPAVLTLAREHRDAARYVARIGADVPERL